MRFVVKRWDMFWYVSDDEDEDETMTQEKLFARRVRGNVEADAETSSCLMPCYSELPKIEEVAAFIGRLQQYSTSSIPC